MSVDEALKKAETEMSPKTVTSASASVEENMESRCRSLEGIH